MSGRRGAEKYLGRMPGAPGLNSEIGDCTNLALDSCTGETSGDERLTKCNPSWRLREIESRVKRADEKQCAPCKRWMETTMPYCVDPDAEQNE